MIWQGLLEVVVKQGQDSVSEVFIARERGKYARMFEFVNSLQPGFSREQKWTISVSTQFGCPLKCVFCDAAFPYMGNISAELMLAQVSAVLDRYQPSLQGDCQKLKIHFSRMGEPAMNPAVIDAIEMLPSLIRSPNVWACVSTTFPFGSEKWFGRLIDVKERYFKGKFQLQVSINSTDEKWRAKLMPFPHASLSEIAEYGNAFFEDGDRRITLNIPMIRGVPLDPKVIRDAFNPEVFAVKLTPLNPTVNGTMSGLMSLIESGSIGAASSMAMELEGLGFNVYIVANDPRNDIIGSNDGQAVRRFLSSDTAAQPKGRRLEGVENASFPTAQKKTVESAKNLTRH